MAQFNRNDKREDEYSETVVALNRVSKTVKGGRVMKFSALVVVGDGKGTVGFGTGKAAEVPDAIRKGIEDAKKNLVKISMKGTTIPHEIIGEFGAGRCSRYRRYRRRCSPCNRRGCRHQGYPHQVPALQQPAERRFRNDAGSEEHAQRCTGCCCTRQGCRRTVRKG